MYFRQSPLKYLTNSYVHSPTIPSYDNDLNATTESRTSNSRESVKSSTVIWVRIHSSLCTFFPQTSASPFLTRYASDEGSCHRPTHDASDKLNHGQSGTITKTYEMYVITMCVSCTCKLSSKHR